MTAKTVSASLMVKAKMETQSRVRQAGTTPRVESRPFVGFRPTTLLKPAGTRPEPAVSVPKATGTQPKATATAEPEEDPPLIRVEGEGGGGLSGEAAGKAKAFGTAP